MTGLIDIDAAYKRVFGTEADDAGKDYWQSQVDSGLINAENIDQSLVNAAPEKAVRHTYKETYGTDYNDYEGINYWSDNITDQNNPVNYQNLGSTMQESTPQTVDKIFSDTLGRAPTEAERKQWTGELNNPNNSINPDNLHQYIAKEEPVTKVDINMPNFKAATVEERLQGLLSKDNPYIKAARASAVEYANSRGLQNSSIAASAGEKSAIESSLPIAQQDASAENELTRNQQAFTYNAALQDAQTQNERDLQFDLLSEQNKYNLSELEVRAALDKENLELEAKLNEQLNQLQIDAGTKDQLIESIGKENQQYQVEFSNIATSTELDPESKDAMLRSLMASHKASIDHMIQLSGFDFDLFPEISAESLSDEKDKDEEETE